MKDNIDNNKISHEAASKEIGKKYRITRNVVAEAFEDIVWGNRT